MSEVQCGDSLFIFTYHYGVMLPGNSPLTCHILCGYQILPVYIVVYFDNIVHTIITDNVQRNYCICYFYLYADKYPLLCDNFINVLERLKNFVTNFNFNMNLLLIFLYIILVIFSKRLAVVIQVYRTIIGNAFFNRMQLMMILCSGSGRVVCGGVCWCACLQTATDKVIIPINTDLK